MAIKNPIKYSYGALGESYVHLSIFWLDSDTAAVYNFIIDRYWFLRYKNVFTNEPFWNSVHVKNL